MLHFDAPHALLLAALLPAAVIYRQRRVRPSAIVFSDISALLGIIPSLRRQLAPLPGVLRVLALLCLIVALARPQFGTEMRSKATEGIAIEMVVDRSGSMQAPMRFGGRERTRLEVVKEVFKDFVRGGSGLAGRPNDLIGIVSFARAPQTVAPLTLAHKTLSQLLDKIKPAADKREDGTAIGDAVALAAARLKNAGQAGAGDAAPQYAVKSKVIILLTDGQNNVGNRTPLEAAKLAKEWGIKIYAIGVGGEQSFVRQPGIFGSFLVPTGPGVDKQTLQAMADATDGIFRMAEDADGLRRIYAEIDELQKSEIEEERFIDYRELYFPWAAAGASLLALELLLATTVLRRMPE